MPARKPHLITLVLCLIIISLQSIYAYNLRQVTNNNGLTNSAVLSLLQDKEGFLWFGTCDGINIYDGIKATPWNGFGKLNLSGFIIENMLETSDSIVWIQTNYSLVKVNKKNRHFTDFPQFKGKFKMIKNNANHIFIVDDNNRLYSATLANDTFYPIPIEGLADKKIINIYIHQTTLVFFTTNEILCYQLTKGADETYAVSPMMTEKSTAIRYGFGEDNLLYWLDGQYNLYRYNLDKPIKHLMGNWNSVLSGKGDISDMIKYKSDFFIAFQTNGLLKLSPASASGFKAEDLGINAGVFVLLKDRTQDIIWIATDGQGVFLYTDDNYSIRSTTYDDLNIHIGKPVRSIYLDPEHTLWLGTKGEGILKLKNYTLNQRPARLQKELITTSNSGLTNNNIYAFAPSSQPILWIGHDGGISYFSYVTKTFSSLQAPEPIQYVHALHEENDSVLWIATVGTGIIRANIAFTPSPHISRMKRYTIDEGTFASNYFFTLYTDKQSIWFGNRGNGLFYIANDSLKNIPLKEDYKNETANDLFAILKQEDTFWLGTANGLIKKTPNKEFCFNKENCGFFNSTIHAMQFDCNQNLWIATNNGLIHFNTRNQNFQNYNQQNGLKVIEYSDGASFTCHDTLFFGGIDGFTTITEDTAFHPVRYTPPLYFTELNILGEEVNIHDYMKETNHSFLLKLNYRQNFFTVTFKIVDYITPNKYSYLYQLNNSEWVYRRENNLSFTQLGYGHHTLNIRYQDVTNGTLSPIYTLHIYITPPWYMTTYAITCYILIMIGAFIFSLKHFLNKQKQKRSLALKQIEQEHKELLYEEKLRFFTNITHEFCTPLALIYGPCERLLNYKLSDAFIKKYVLLIQSNAKHLNTLIQEIIDFRRLETGHHICHITSVDVAETSRNIAQTFTDLAEQHHIRFEVRTDNQILWNTDKNGFITILNNLISNAFKYTPEEGLIRITIKTNSENQLLLSVYNTGKGIAPKDMPLIFNRYKILDNIDKNEIGGLSARNGLGLAICHSIVEILKGTIQIKSEVGQFAEFIVTLPFIPVSPDKTEQNTQAHTNDHATNREETPSITATKMVNTESMPSKKASSILIVDDNQDMLELLKDIFSPGYNIATALTAQQAFAQIKEQQPSLIITDVMMPEINGIEFTKRLKQNKHTMSIPIIILSAKNSDNEKVEGVNAGADAYIGKPFDINYLQAVAERLIDNSKKMMTYYNTSACAFNFSHGNLRTSADKDFIQKLQTYIEEHIDKEDLSQSELAAVMQISTRTLYRRMKELDLGSPNDYIKECRMRHVVKLLETTSLTIQEIMYQTGFINRSHFYKEFTKRFHTTPKEYRNAQKQKDSIL